MTSSPALAHAGDLNRIAVLDLLAVPHELIGVRPVVPAVAAAAALRATAAGGGGRHAAAAAAEPAPDEALVELGCWQGAVARQQAHGRLLRTAGKSVGNHLI